MLKDFRAFVLRGNVVDLAVGVVIGAAFGAIVNSVVEAFLNPLTALFGSTGLKDLSFAVGTKTAKDGTPVPNDFNYGLVLDATLKFILIAAIVFFLVVKPVNALMARLKADQPVDATMRECPECTSKISVRATRCSFCTAVVPAQS